jgi:proline dehydrogenase
MLKTRIPSRHRLAVLRRLVSRHGRRHRKGPRRAEVDTSLHQLGARLVSEEARRAGVFLAFGTHDRSLIQRFGRHVTTAGIPKDADEFDMLYGTGRAEQVRLVSAGYTVRVRMSCGESWFPWYMCRLAERPANVWFVVRNLFGG